MDIASFTPVSAAIGGALIGAAAVMLMALNGRIAGVSGIIAGVLAPLRGTGGQDFAWRAAFVAGLFLAPVLYGITRGTPIEVAFPHPLWMIGLGGLLVGYGVRLGSGCTSGHGVCGIARLSKRSLAATATFMATAMATVFVVHQFIGN